MPTYEYKCKKCGYYFEELQSITAAPLTDCPKEGCDGKVYRIISSGAGFLFKGSGFYITDYRSDSYKKAADADKSKSSGESKTDGSKTESKPSEKKVSSAATSSAPKAD